MPIKPGDTNSAITPTRWQTGSMIRPIATTGRHKNTTRVVEAETHSGAVNDCTLFKLDLLGLAGSPPAAVQRPIRRARPSLPVLNPQRSLQG